MKQQLISIGSMCQLRSQLLLWNPELVSKETQFFDWLMSDFQSFLFLLQNKDQIDQVMSKENFYLDETHTRKNIIMIQHKHFTMVSTHDIHYQEDVESQMPEFIEKYKRRYQRLIDLLYSNSANIHLLYLVDHMNLPPYYPTMEDYSTFFSLIPSKNISLSVIIPPKLHNSKFDIHPDVDYYFLQKKSNYVEVKNDEVWKNHDYQWFPLFNGIIKTQPKCVIMTMAQDEDHILKEWIVYHILLGFDTIYIFDDHSKNPIQNLVNELPIQFKNRVVVLRIENDFFTPEFIYSSLYDEPLYKKYKKVQQPYFQNYFLKYYRNVAKWCLFSDCDEFLYLNKNIDLYTFLDQFEKEGYTTIYLPWLMFGTSFFIHQPPGFVIENFVLHKNYYQENGKSFVQLQHVVSIYSTHLLETPKMFQYDCKQPLLSLDAHLNHYNKNSVKTFFQRRLRKEVGHVQGEQREANRILQFVLASDDFTTEWDVSRYENILHSLHHWLPNVPRALKNNSLDLCPFVFHSEKKGYIQIIEHENQQEICQNFLFELMHDLSLRYATWKEVLPSNFDIQIYKQLYPEWKDDVRKRYLTFPNQIYNLDDLPSDFEVDTYRECYPHLGSMNDVCAKKHYIEHGQYENLIYTLKDLPTDFNVNCYQECYPHLQNLNELEAKIHYLQHGRFENLVYSFTDLPKDFDVHNYRIINPHLKNLDDVQAKVHYLQHGQFEKLSFK